MPGPKRLIEVDLPLKEVSAQARREKSIRHGHLSTLHIWWARRPLAACRAVALAALLPDPADPDCPGVFLENARATLTEFRNRVGGSPVGDSPGEIRKAILSFIARFSSWDTSTIDVYLSCAHALVRAAYPENPPLVIDPFAGGGAIPLEALRIGADVWAGDVNPVAALLLKVVLEDIPRYGTELADAVAKWGQIIRERVEADLGRFYPADPDGAVPIAYLWARTVTCEGPACGAEVPLLRQLWLSKKKGRQVALQIIVDQDTKTIDFKIVESPSSAGEGTVKRGSAKCPVCGFVTPVKRVRVQANDKGGLPVRLIAVVRTYPHQQGRNYRVANDRDLASAVEAKKELVLREKQHTAPLSLIPNESVPLMSGVFNAPIYALTDWSRYFLSRQALALSSFAAAIREAYEEIAREVDPGFARALATCLGIILDRQADRLCTLGRWHVPGEKIEGLFSRQAIPMVWDFPEANPFSGSTGNWDGAVEWVEKVIRHVALSLNRPGQTEQSDARQIPFPDESVACIFSDPPYYNAVPYADLSDFFYVWLRRSIGSLYPTLFAADASPKDSEICEMAGWDSFRYANKDKGFFEKEMTAALTEARRVLSPDGVAVIVFAHKTTGGWEAMLRALLEAGWTVTASWPIDTEMSTRLRARDSAALASSVHIVCRPRSEDAGVGEWRSVRPELERRVAEWLPRLSEEGIEGADAIFACLGPAMEVFSRYERVETADGTAVGLSAPSDNPDAPAFLPAVWAAVAREALTMIFENGDAQGFEEDARITAVWLWTVRAAAKDNKNKQAAESDESVEDDDGEGATSKKKVMGFVLDFDTARKIAQPLGVHLEALNKPGGIVAIKDGIARLVPVTERGAHLLGHRSQAPRPPGGTLFDTGEFENLDVTEGRTTLDRLHQCLLLWIEGETSTVRSLLAQPTYGADPALRRLANVLSRLYPDGSPEKRAVDGVLGVARQVAGT